MNHRMATHCVIATVAVTLASAAHPQIAVPVTGEPHHHQVYSDTHVRSFSVEVPAHTSTLLHQHERDYVWVGLGAATFVNAVAGKAEVPVVAVNGSVHFSKGGFAHVARIKDAKNSGCPRFYPSDLRVPQFAARRPRWGPPSLEFSGRRGRMSSGRCTTQGNIHKRRKRNDDQR